MRLRVLHKGSGSSQLKDGRPLDTASRREPARPDIRTPTSNPRGHNSYGIRAYVTNALGYVVSVVLVPALVNGQSERLTPVIRTEGVLSADHPALRTSPNT